MPRRPIDSSRASPFLQVTYRKRLLSCFLSPLPCSSAHSDSTCVLTTKGAAPQGDDPSVMPLSWLHSILEACTLLFATLAGSALTGRCDIGMNLRRFDGRQ